jgi:hypothetical protein
MVGELPKSWRSGGCGTEELTRPDLMRKLLKGVPKEEPLKREVKQKSKEGRKKK